MNHIYCNKKYLVGDFENFPQLHEYYTKCKEYKRKIKELIGKSVSKYNTKNVWNQWIIRVLGNEKKNLHLFASKESVEMDRVETLKHICLKPNEFPQDADETYNEIVEYCDKIHKQFNKMKVDLMNNPDALLQVSSSIHILESMPFLETERKSNKILHYKIDIKKYTRLLELYQKAESDSKLFNFYLFELLHNYGFIEGNTHQWSVPPVIMKLLKNKFQVQNELFASPINHYFDDYFSLFEIDTFFGSKGNALKFDILPEGCYEVNPPFVEETMERISNSMMQSLKKSSLENKFQFFFFVIPWKDCQAFKLMTDRQYLIDHIELEREQHYYYEPEFNRYNQAKFYTQLILVGTEKAKSIYNKEIKRTIISSFQRNRNY